ncbi:hypothetical protein [Sulfurimonas sp. HSL-1716]|uniref:hypothetical protein n=1 Tax=Hydrocurvibacter sulfurireducens TaxID=3131937 RepID=UPI0031F87C55
MKTFLYITALFSLLVLGGCSSKQVFEPAKDTVGSWKYKNDLKDSIVDVTSNGALLQNGSVIVKDNVIDMGISIDKERLIGVSDKWIITSEIDGNLTLISKSDKTLKDIFELKKTVAAASVKGDLLAVLFASNELAIYSVKTKKIIFHSQGNAPLIVNAKIVNPYFLDDLVLFLTLDGRIVIVNSKEKKVLRSIIVSSAENFNNITAFSVVNDNLVAATGYKILSLTNKEIREPYEIRNMKYDKDGIYIATKQGEVVNLTPSLQVKAKTKFPFAHFLGMIVTDKRVYLLEKQGYIISLTKDLSSYDLYDVSISKDSYVYVGDKAFYVDDEYFSIK